MRAEAETSSIATSQGKPSTAGSHQKPRARQGTRTPSEPWKEPTPPMPAFGTLASRTERIHFCFKPTGLCQCVTAALGNECKGLMANYG